MLDSLRPYQEALPIGVPCLALRNTAAALRIILSPFLFDTTVILSRNVAYLLLPGLPAVKF